MAAAPRAALQPLDELDALIEAGRGHLHAQALGAVAVDGRRLPLVAVTLGNPDPAVPALGLFGGVHGLERIGTEVVLAALRHTVARLRWDRSLHRLLQDLRLVFMPLVNPGGLWRGTRANPAGVDLMRNAPVECVEGALPLLGGHRASARLPWYRGPAGAPMQPEARALCELVETELMPHTFAISVDCHSGFGLVDRIWLPYAHTARPVPVLPELLALAELVDDSLLHHRYVVEPQSRQYRAHGDLWDHLLLRALARSPASADAPPPRVLLPLTLEMGSWLWVKKNPRQAFSRDGIFNPLIEHRQQRVLRRHLGLLELLQRAACSHAHWRPPPALRALWQQRALNRWYRGRPSASAASGAR